MLFRSFTFILYFSPTITLTLYILVPAIIYIDKWGRRPMLLIGLAFMGFWLFLVGGLQARFGHWGIVDGSDSRESYLMFFALMASLNWVGVAVWVISGHSGVTKGIIVCSYLFVCR